MSTAPLLREASKPSTCETQEEKKVGSNCQQQDPINRYEDDLRVIICGSLNVQQASDRLDAHVSALQELCLEVYTRPAGQLASLAAEAIETFSTPENNACDVAHKLVTKRALLLIGLHLEPEVGEHFSQGGARVKSMVTDLRDRVLPFVVPSFTAGLGQDPRSFCNTVMLLSQMWTGEALWDGAFMGSVKSSSE